jgi:hypothetical protein
VSPETQAALDVARAFEKARVTYYLCGSMASSTQGSEGTLDVYVPRGEERGRPGVLTPPTKRPFIAP